MRGAKIVVYTAISKGFDALKPPLPLWQDEASFVAFTEEPQVTPGWETRPLHREFKDPCRNAKIHKVLPNIYFPKADYSLWVDGCIFLKSPIPLQLMIKTYLKHHDLALFKNPIRDCVYQEGLYCLKFKLDSPELITRQMQRYSDEGYPERNGMVECTVILRRHTKAIQQFNEAWYDEIQQGSRRDQLSFNYIANKLGLQYSQLPGTMNLNPYFDRVRHIGRRYCPSRMQTDPRKQLSRQSIAKTEKTA